MNVMTKFYYPADADLIAMRLRYGVRFNKMIRDCIRAFIRHEPYTLYVPENVERYVRPLKDPLSFILVFDDDKDDDVIKWLKDLGSSRLAVIRSVLRMHYDTLPAWIFLYDPEQVTLSKKAAKAHERKRRELLRNGFSVEATPDGPAVLTADGPVSATDADHEKTPAVSDDPGEGGPVVKEPPSDKGRKEKAGKQAVSPAAKNGPDKPRADAPEEKDPENGMKESAAEGGANASAPPIGASDQNDSVSNTLDDMFADLLGQ